MKNRELSREDIIELLNQFCLELKESNISGIISLAGGAAIALAHNPVRQFTVDIDALLPAHPQMSRIISKIAVANGLEFDWINGDIEEFIPFGLEDAWIFYEEIHGITVRIASAPFLLALKLTAGRPTKDYKDIEVLIDELNIQNMQTCLDLIKKYKVNRPVEDQTIKFVQRVLERNRAEEEEDEAEIDALDRSGRMNIKFEELLSELNINKDEAARMAINHPDISLIFQLEALKSLRETPSGEYKFGPLETDRED